MCLVCVVCFLSQVKDAALSDDYGKDLASVQALQRKHEGFEVCSCVPTCSYHACYYSQGVTHPKCTIRQMVGGDQDQPSSSSTSFKLPSSINPSMI